MRNPGFSFSRLRGADEVEIERSIMFDIIGLLTIPVRKNIESGRFEAAKLQAASHAIQLASETRKAYFTAVAAQQSVEYAQQVASAAEASAELTQRMAKVGNWSKLNQAREQAFYAESVAQLATAKQAAAASRERLTRLLGLWGNDAHYKLPQRLPELPSTPQEASNIETRPMEQRLDVQMAKRDAQATANALGLTRTTGFINVLDAGYANKSVTGQPRETATPSPLSCRFSTGAAPALHVQKPPTCKRCTALLT